MEEKEKGKIITKIFVGKESKRIEGWDLWLWSLIATKYMGKGICAKTSLNERKE